MPVNNIARIQLFNMIKVNFMTEINYFAHDEVDTTTHQVGTAARESWTHYLLEAGIINQLPKIADRFIELERTMTSLYCLITLAQDREISYLALIDAQLNNPEISPTEILSKDRFNILYENSYGLISQRKNFFIIFNLILLSDIFKSQAARTIIHDNQLEINTGRSSEDVMAELLLLSEQKIFKVLPSFLLLEDDVRQTIKQIYPLMKTCFGHIHFLESGEKAFMHVGFALTRIPIAERELCMQLAFMAQYLDAAGSQGQQRISGSLACTVSFTQSYDLVYLKLMDLNFELIANGNHAVRAGKKIFAEYLSERSKMLGLNENAIETPFLTRLGAMLRGTTAQIGALLMNEFISLNATIQRILIEELGFEETQIESWNNVAYLATVILNQSREAISRHQLQDAVSKAMDAAICLALLIKYIAREYNKNGELVETKRTISFREFATLAAAYPKQLNPNYFNASNFGLNPDTFKVEKNTPLCWPSSSLTLFKPAIFRSIRQVTEVHDPLGLKL